MTCIRPRLPGHHEFAAALARRLRSKAESDGSTALSLRRKRATSPRKRLLQRSRAAANRWSPRLLPRAIPATFAHITATWHDGLSSASRNPAAVDNDFLACPWSHGRNRCGHLPLYRHMRANCRWDARGNRRGDQRLAAARRSLEQPVLRGRCCALSASGGGRLSRRLRFGTQTSS